MARNLRALLPLVEEFGPGRIAFCTDDKDPDDIAENGHINGMVRDAVAAGTAPEDALVLASLNPALWHGLDHLGALAPGYQADVLLLPDLESFQPELVLKRGRPIEEIARSEVPEWVKNTVRIEPVGAERFRIPWQDEARARVIGLVLDQVVTDSLVEAPTVRDGEAVADADRDLAKIAVLERHLGTGRMGIGLVRGFGLKRGALGSTVAHDAHNLVVVGMNDADMARVVERLAELGGGIVAVEDGEVLAELPLPVGGLLSDLPLADVVARSSACTEAAVRLGCRGATPFLTMSFLALSVIPSLKITDQGLVDVDRFELVPLEANDLDHKAG
jgi:adenine deaminase